MSFEPYQLGSLIHDAARLIRKRFEQQAISYGLSSAQWRLLVHVIREGAVSQARLADRLEIEPISVSRLVDRMEQAGWVTREADPNDRRIKMVVATEKAHEYKTDLRAMAGEVFEEAMAGIDPASRETVLHGLATISENLTHSLSNSTTAMKDKK